MRTDNKSDISFWSPELIPNQSIKRRNRNKKLYHDNNDKIEKYIRDIIQSVLDDMKNNGEKNDNIERKF